MPYYCYPPIPERAFRGVGKRSTVELSCQSPPHPDIISFPNPPCICKNKCTAGKIRIQIDQNENPSKTRSLHSILQALFGDSLFMIFGVTMTSLELTHFLQVQGYTSVEQMLGYSGAIDVNNKYNLQPYRQPDSKKNGVAAPACDFDHCPGRPIGEIIAHIIEAGFPCSHASNIKQEYVRAEAEDRCFGFSLFQYAKKTAVERKIAAEKAKKAADERKRQEVEKRQANSKRKRLEEVETKRLEEEKRLQVNIAMIGISSNLMLEMVDKVTGLTTFSYSCTLKKDMAEKLVELGLSGSKQTAKMNLQEYIKVAQLQPYAPIKVYNKIARLSIVTENVPMTLDELPRNT